MLAGAELLIFHLVTERAITGCWRRGDDRVAGMSTVVVHINPRDKYRYGMKFWINQQNGLMMKSSLINENGKVVEQVMFTSLELFDDNEKLVIDTMPKIDENYTLVRYHSGDSSKSFTADSAWQLADAPGGFWRESVLKRKVPGTDHFVQQMVYTDAGADDRCRRTERRSGENA